MSASVQGSKSNKYHSGAKSSHDKKEKEILLDELVVMVDPQAIKVCNITTNMMLLLGMACHTLAAQQDMSASIHHMARHCATITSCFLACWHGLPCNV